LTTFLLAYIRDLIETKSKNLKEFENSKRKFSNFFLTKNWCKVDLSLFIEKNASFEQFNGAKLF